MKTLRERREVARAADPKAPCAPYVAGNGKHKPPVGARTPENVAWEWAVWCPKHGKVARLSSRRDALTSAAAHEWAESKGYNDR